MSISPFFRNLLSAYQAEIDDLSFDSDGRDVLRQRLADKRGEIGFLVQMMEVSPEMVAVVFHQGFAFRRPAAMEKLLGCEAGDVLPWSELSDAIEMTPWAQGLAQTVLQAPGGEWFMAVAAGLQYLAGKAEAPVARLGDDESDGEIADDGDADGEQDELDFSDGDDEPGGRGGARARDEAGADWLAAQGFDRKE